MVGCVNDLGLLLDFVKLVVDKGSLFLVELHGGCLRAVLVVIDLLHELHQVEGVQLVTVVIIKDAGSPRGWLSSPATRGMPLFRLPSAYVTPLPASLFSMVL